MFYPTLTPVEFQESHHPIVRVDAIAKVSRNKVLPAELSGKQVFHYSIPNVQDLSTGKIEDGDTIDSDKWLITEEAVLISKLNPRKSTICLATPQENVTVASTEFVVLPAGNSIDNRYLMYVLESEIVRHFLSSRTTSATRSHQRVNPHDIITLGIPWPEESTRTKIVKELNRELAEIDELIAEQEQLQALLLERLVALTFELATDSSNPDRYETGHHFWKTLPEGWTLQKLGWHFDIGNGSTPKSDNPQYWTDAPEEGFPWFNSSIVNSKIAIEPSRYVTKQAIRDCHLPVVPQKSLLVGLTGQGKTRGMVTQTGIDTTINQHIAFLTPRQNSLLNVDFVQLALQAAYPELRFMSDGNGGTKGALTCEHLQHFKIPAPGLPQQLSILKNFRKRQAEIQQLIESANVSDLLAERKAALLNHLLKS